MATVQSLKKKLQVIRSTRKLTQAMKTASTVKYSKLSGLYSAYALYEKQYAELYGAFYKELATFDLADEKAPVCYVVISSNKGMCGSFNTELLSYAHSIIGSDENALVFTCGKKAAEFFSKKGIKAEKSYIFPDVPDYSSAKELFADVQQRIDEGRVSSVRLIYPEYKNMISHIEDDEKEYECEEVV